LPTLHMGIQDLYHTIHLNYDAVLQHSHECFHVTNLTNRCEDGLLLNFPYVIGRAINTHKIYALCCTEILSADWKRKSFEMFQVFLIYMHHSISNCPQWQECLFTGYLIFLLHIFTWIASLMLWWC